MLPWLLWLGVSLGAGEPGFSPAEASTTSSPEASPGASRADMAAHAHIAELLHHAVDAASLFIPARWISAFPQPLSTVELLERWNYPVESWQVETADGHVLILHRIPAPGQPPVLLLHGMFCSSAEWLLAGPDRSLALQLSDAGYDVWMANFRGNPYSLGHRDITTLQAAFWNYSFHEHGVLDLQAVLTEVRANTPGAGPITVVAHSLGSTALLVLLSEKPEFNKMLLHAVLLGPVASLRGVGSYFLRVLAHYGHLVGMLLQVLGMDQVLVTGGITSRVFSLLCHPSAPTADMCKLAVFAVAGYSPDLFDPDLLPQIFIQYASGASVQTLVHLSECLVAGTFIKPQGRQGRDQREEYNLTAITVPLTLVYANNDLISGPQEALWLHNKTKEVSSVYEVPHPTFNHMDYLYAINPKEHIYNFVVDDVGRLAKTAEPPRHREGAVNVQGGVQGAVQGTVQGAVQVGVQGGTQGANLGSARESARGSDQDNPPVRVVESDHAVVQDAPAVIKDVRGVVHEGVHASVLEGVQGAGQGSVLEGVHGLGHESVHLRGQGSVAGSIQVFGEQERLRNAGVLNERSINGVSETAKETEPELRPKSGREDTHGTAVESTLASMPEISYEQDHENLHEKAHDKKHGSKGIALANSHVTDKESGHRRNPHESDRDNLPVREQAGNIRSASRFNVFN